MQTEMQTKRTDYAQVEQSQKFKALLSTKKKFLWPMTVFFLVFYFSLPILTSYTTFLNAPAIGPISWAWVFAFSQFIMTWALCVIYSRKSAKFDELVDEINEERKGDHL